MSRARTATGRSCIRVKSWQGNETHWQVLSQAWDHEEQHLRVFVNWADYRSQCWVDLSFGNLQGKEVILRDLLSDKVYIRDGVELMMRGIYLDLDPWEAHAFDCEVRDAAAVTDESTRTRSAAMMIANPWLDKSKLQTHTFFVRPPSPHLRLKGDKGASSSKTVYILCHRRRYVSSS